MKIIQTLYVDGSTPALHQSMGFASAELNWMSWALSCLQLRRYFTDVQLYTNEAGYDVLIRKLQLPYTQVHPLPALLFPSQLWAFPKIHTYSLQQKPFLHVDGDVFFWAKPSEQLLAEPLVAQNLETNSAFYHSLATRLQQHHVRLPDAITALLRTPQPLSACNAGILGGHDLDFFARYTQGIFHFLDINRLRWPLLNHAAVNMLYEQVYFHALAVQLQKKISYYFPSPVADMTYPGFAEFSGVPYTTHFVHLMGVFKRDPHTCLMLVRRLRRDYPEYYERILNICRQEHVPLLFNYDADLKRRAMPRTADAYWTKIAREERHQCHTLDIAFDPLNLPRTRFRITSHLKFREERHDEPESSVCYVPCGFRRSWIPLSCDALDNLLIEQLQHTRGFEELASAIAPHFDNSTADDLSLRKLLALRLRRGCDHNLFRIVTNRRSGINR